MTEAGTATAMAAMRISSITTLCCAVVAIDVRGQSRAPYSSWTARAPSLWLARMVPAPLALRGAPACFSVATPLLDLRFSETREEVTPGERIELAEGRDAPCDIAALKGVVYVFDAGRQGRGVND